MDLGLAGKIAVVTGASKGIGAAAARCLAAEGANLMLAARSLDQLEALAEKLTQRHGVQAKIWPGDLREPRGADEAIAATMAAYGRIDIAVTSAGASQGGVFWEMPDQVWTDSLSLKFMGTIRTLRAVVPVMRAQGAGRIVVVVGSRGKQPTTLSMPASAANAGLLAVVKGLADEVAADGVIVNAISPGPTRTERWARQVNGLAASRGVDADSVEADFLGEIPLKRLGEPEEIARLIAFLASESAGNMTGASLTADGGWTRALA
jgi:3-oxoacyl-[acyl-carrier protein] reductase